MKKYIDKSENIIYKKAESKNVFLKDRFLKSLVYEKALTITEKNN